MVSLYSSNSCHLEVNLFPINKLPTHILHELTGEGKNVHFNILLGAAGECRSFE